MLLPVFDDILQRKFSLPVHTLAYANTADDWGNYCRDLFIEFFVRETAPVKQSGIVDVDEYKPKSVYLVCNDFTISCTIA